MPLRPQTAYSIRGVLWLPHYTIKDAFVGPGALHYRTSKQLLAMGGIAVTLELWPRRYE